MRMLVEHALNKAKEMGYGAVFLGGNPKLYARFGFEPSSAYGIYHENRQLLDLICLLIQIRTRNGMRSELKWGK